MSGFDVLYVDAKKLIEHHVPFAVILKNNEVQAYATDPVNWKRVLDSHKNEGGWGADSYKPLLQTNPTFEDTVQQLGWIMGVMMK